MHNRRLRVRARLCAVWTFLSVCVFHVCFCAYSAETTTIRSPNGKVVVDITIGERATYTASFNGEQIIGESALGLTFHNAKPFGALKVVGVQTREIDETYKGIGRKSEYRDRCVETSIDVQEIDAPNRKLRYAARAYDEGFALRYVLLDDPGVFDDNGECCITSEETEFAFGKDYDVWGAWFQAPASNHEGRFQKKKLSDVKQGNYLGRPLIVQGERFIAALTEADLLDWSGVQFTASEKASAVKTILAPRADKRGCVVCQGACASPWRVVILAESAVKLIDASDIVRNLASPCEFDASWVKPGNTSWDWWAPKKGRRIDDEAARELIDLSAELGWDYAMIDAGWYKRKDKNVNLCPEGLLVVDGFDVPAIVEYGKTKNVKLLLWVDWPDLIQVDVRKTLKRLADWGVAGVKIDHMNSHSQEMVAALTEATKIAAEYRLLVDYHGMYEPTGMERTFPNQLTREGIQGNEYFRGRALPSSFVAALPFTRCLIGPGDYTPGGFRNAQPEDFRTLKEQTGDDASTMVVGTRAHELALCMLLDSPLRCLCDLPRVYRGQPGLEYLRELPAAWDDTIALDGQIGEYCVLARRSGTTWRVSAITNEKPREIEIKLDFLDPDKTYEAVYYQDSPESDKDANAIEIKRAVVHQGDAALIKTVRNGGWNAVFVER